MTKNVIVIEKPSESRIRIIEDEYVELPCKGYVYALQYGDLVKIGCSKAPSKRYKQLFHNGFHYGNIGLGKLALSIPCVNFRSLEAHLHKIFKEQRRESTELFDVVFADVVKTMQTLKYDTDYESAQQTKIKQGKDLTDFVINTMSQQSGLENLVNVETFVNSFDLGDQNEVRIGLDYMCNPPQVSLATNHFENETVWGAQVLKPEEAIKIANSLIAYAKIARAIQPHFEEKLLP